MDLLRTDVGLVLGEEVEGPEAFRRLFDGLGLSGDRFVVKPNWFSSHPGMPTEADVLDMVLAALPGRKLVIEGYSGMRNDGSKAPKGTAQKRRWIAEQDLWFRKHHGLQAVIERHGAEYLSVTEEVWGGRVVPQAEVAAAVEARLPAVSQPELYGYMPRALWEWRGAPLVSLGRVKPIYSLSTKNLFGLIPDPLRMRWHGKGDANLGRSIADIATIYCALFNVVGVVEAVHSAVVYADDGKHAAPWGRWHLPPEPRLAFAGRPTPLLDAVVLTVVGAPPDAHPFLQLWPAAREACVPAGWRERLTQTSA